MIGRPLPVMPRAFSLLLGSSAVVLLSGPRAESHAQPRSNTCAQADKASLVGQGGERFDVVAWECEGVVRVEACVAGHCEPPAASGLRPDVDESGWLDPLLVLEGAQGARHVLAVTRHGQGAYPDVTLFTLTDGMPVKHEHVGIPVVLARARDLLAPDETYGAHGARLEVEGDRLVFVKGIYLPEDANCCPSRGLARIFARLDVDHFVFDELHRQGP